MACEARVAVPAIIEECPQVFDGIKSLVDFGGSNGTVLAMLVKAFPWIHGIHFDLPYVVAVAAKVDGVENIGGDMFEGVPKAGAAFLMKCKEAIPEDKGERWRKKIKREQLDFVRLILDMVMMAHTNKGKERTLKEWKYVLGEAGFTRFNVEAIHATQSRSTEMEDIKVRGKKEDEDEKAEVDIWNYVFGYVKIAVVKCAIELGIADAIDKHGSPMTLSQLTTTLKCQPSRLYRIMRFLVHYQIFKEEPITKDSIGFALTPLSRRLSRHGERSMAAMILLQSSPVMLAPWHSLSARVLDSGNSPFETAHGKDVWSYAEENPGHSKLIDEAMACDARVAVRALIEGCPQVFDGIKSLVDVGGGNGTALSMLVKAFPWIHGIDFDLPRVVAVAPKVDGIKYVGGDMFKCVPKADAAFFMWVLHDWGDEECIQILKKCKEAIPQDKGKVIIVESVLEEDKNDKLEFVGLMLDMVMMTHTNKGKERTLKEWKYVLGEAGFTRIDVKPIHAVQSVIEAYI
ncbi:3'-hydroxy-N-methyl-(S)-coclaurine 4'-O-methyltransferase-like [Gossypium australe]|uniref:3'-hydroxy-N-methyl-(S)-coclaurine 4'-O-methyltransferase-like n=1 Tax=Gossypium australe TaxID=47621 RepID=A0A5B6UW34_9ROSI|nr:3'-hydroxy-N-methyl-(S)-coclaurine 4'-O-methyltransferase-like [Gossypium australe]